MYQTFHWDVCELAKTIVGMCFAGEVVLIACCCSFATVLSWMNTDTLTHMHGVWKMASSILWMGFGVCPNDGIRKDCQEQHGVWSWDWHSRMRSVCTVWVRQHRKQFQNVPSGHGKNWEEKLSMEKLGRVVRYSDRAKKSNDSSLSNDFPRSLDRHKWTSPKRWLIGSAWGIKIHVNQMYHDVQEVTYRGGEDTFQTPTLPPPPPPPQHTHTHTLLARLSISLFAYRNWKTSRNDLCIVGLAGLLNMYQCWVKCPASRALQHQWKGDSCKLVVFTLFCHV